MVLGTLTCAGGLTVRDLCECGNVLLPTLASTGTTIDSVDTEVDVLQVLGQHRAGHIRQGHASCELGWAW